MARLWDIGRSEPIKVGKASPTEGTLPGAIYFLTSVKALQIRTINSKESLVLAL